jgi:succinate dehydrogenase/fumarate reductase flavoprotein subunit
LDISPIEIWIVPIIIENDKSQGNPSADRFQTSLETCHLERDNLPLSHRIRFVNGKFGEETRVAGPLDQSILDALTDIAMPKTPPARAPRERAHAGGFALPLHRCEALVLGSGAAGLRAAVELKRRHVDVVVATQAVYGGTSACSGSDKQTLHTACDSAGGDDFNALAEALGAGGAMDEDTAYVEAVGSLKALDSLAFIGLPIPRDSFGAALRYKTDHDEAGRATSCGPRTSRLMVKVLAQEAAQLGVPILNRIIGARILVDEGPPRRAVGLLAVSPRERGPDNPLGLVVFLFDALVLASGGPGELYRDSVYPKHCFGALGMALEVGIEAVNLTESQFGIGTTRDGFPWNLSGTYAQAMPYVFSRDPAGRERNFLADYYRTTQELASNLFRKGYQWPFHCQRLLDFGSSLFDLAVFRETQTGRKVLMDFNRNPAPVPGDAPFSLDRLDADVSAYLANNEALLATPIERLRRMNPLSIELYKRYKKDITREPLAFAVNNQHMNGGVAVDVWGRASLAGCYAAGEAAGTHGVTRPGGAALVAGQVFGQRCAEHIAASRGVAARTETPLDIVEAGVAALLGGLREEGGLAPRDIEREVQARMSESAGFVCSREGVRAALEGARALNARIRAEGIRLARPDHAMKAVQWRQMAFASEAVLTALDFYVASGGGSRGARVLCDPAGAATPQTRLGPLSDYRFIPECKADRERQIVVSRAGAGFACATRPIRRRNRAAKAYFERDWSQFLSGSIYRSKS